MGQDAKRSNLLAGTTAHSLHGVWQADWSGQLAPQAAPEGVAIAAWLPPPPQPEPEPHAMLHVQHSAPVAAAAPPAEAASVASVPDSAFGASARALQAAAVQASATPAYPALYVFGDSLSDVGNQFTANGGTAPLPPYFDGRFSNGPLWIEDYAAHFGMPDPKASLLGGTDFAVGGARSGASDFPAAGKDLPHQFQTFAAQVPTPVHGALYSVDIGGNDLIAMLDTGRSIPDLQAMVAQSVQAEMAFISDLASRGAVNFLLLNTPDLGQAPEFAGTSLAGDASQLTAYYNAQVAAALVPLALGDHLNVDIVDTYSLIDQAAAAPAAYGFSNVTDPLWSGTPGNPNSGVLATQSPAGQAQYLFWDHLHPTAAGQALIAAGAENVVFR